MILSSGSAPSPPWPGGMRKLPPHGPHRRGDDVSMTKKRNKQLQKIHMVVKSMVQGKRKRKRKRERESCTSWAIITTIITVLSWSLLPSNFIYSSKFFNSSYPSSSSNYSSN